MVSPQTKCNGYNVTVSNSLCQFVISYLDNKFTKLSRYSLHRYMSFPKHYHYLLVMEMSNCITVMSNTMSFLCPALLHFFKWICDLTFYLDIM